MWGWASPDILLTCDSGDNNIAPVSLRTFVNGLVLMLTVLISTHGLYEVLGLEKRLSPEEETTLICPATRAEMRKESSRGSVPYLGASVSWMTFCGGFCELDD